MEIFTQPNHTKIITMLKLKYGVFYLIVVIAFSCKTERSNTSVLLLDCFLAHIQANYKHILDQKILFYEDVHDLMGVRSSKFLPNDLKRVEGTALAENIYGKGMMFKELKSIEEYKLSVRKSSDYCYLYAGALFESNGQYFQAFKVKNSLFLMLRLNIDGTCEVVSEVLK